MTLEVFTELINTIKAAERKSFAAYQLGIDLVEFETQTTYALWLVIKAHYGEAGADWISWFLYDKQSISGEILKAHDSDGNEICDTIESLWKEVEAIRKSDDFVEYSLKKKNEPFDINEFLNRMNNFFNKQKDE